jgi:NAD(P)-dependent dehydrogenase (short-subunit alcohol dehydrogenase family)
MLSGEGADIVAFDLCESLESPLHPGATEEDLEETQRLVEANGQRCIAVRQDARDLPGLQQLAARTMDEFGRIDTLLVNHGIWAVSANSWELDEASWHESIDVLLTGAWKVTAAFIPKIIESGRGGSIVLTSSVAGLNGQPGSVAYTAAKHGVLGLMRTLAWELGSESIRVNAVLPGAVETAMIREGGTLERSVQDWPRFFSLDRSLLPVKPGDGGGGVLMPDVVSKTMLFLVSDESAYLTGVALPVDGGWLNF